jgi:two-component system, cell cycle response regulator DivK
MPEFITYAAKEAAHGVAADGHRRPLILIAEDHEDTRQMLRLVLERCGCDVLEAADGEEAVRLAESARPDLVLLDRSLPRLDGLAVARLVRAREQAARVPIIFLSGHAEAVARTAAFEAGCDDYLVKPVELNRLTSAVARHLAPSV